MATAKNKKGVPKVICEKCGCAGVALRPVGPKTQKAQWCDVCYAAHGFQCAHCSQYKERAVDFSAKRGDNDLCHFCYFHNYRECTICKHAFLESEGEVTPSAFYCAPCSVNRFFHCVYGGHTMEASSLWNDVPGEGKICCDCKHNFEREQNQAPIEDYSFKPRARFRGTSKNKLFFGFELEVERKQRSEIDPPRRSTHETIAKNLRNAVLDENGKQLLYLKYDGSLSDGFEIVSHPFSWSWLQANKSRLDAIFELTKRGYISHDSKRCGMHIHMSKAAFGPLHLFRFMQFFQKEKDFILKISQRGHGFDSMGYARISYGDSVTRKNLMQWAKKKGGHSERRQALNLRPQHTAEVRIFRGTLKKERFFKNLEFCQALYEFTLQNREENCKLEYFIGYVHRYRNEFPNLFAFLEEKYKFTILKKPSERKAGAKVAAKTAKFQPKEAIKFSGPKPTSTAIDTDVSDADWEEVVARTVKDKEDGIKKLKFTNQVTRANR